MRPAFFAAMLVSALVFPIAFAGVKDLQLRRHVDEPLDLAGAAAAPPARGE